VTIPLIDLRRETARLRPELDAAIARVVASGRFVLTREDEQFERAFAAYCGTTHAVGVASGTDAITIALLACGVRAGDEVITAANTCVPTIVGIERAGATPVLADVDAETYTLDPEQVERRLTSRTRALLPVHLYGQTADMGPLLELAAERNLVVVEDCAQAHGATWTGRRAGSIGNAAAFSFYPTKNLGALGDAGAVVTSDDTVYEQAGLLRNYGERARFEHVLHGLNSRLDALQAAILSAKLPQLDAANARRRELAARYDAAFAGTDVVPPAVGAGRGHAYHLYVIQAPRRDELRGELERNGIGTGVHYQTPIHRQPAYTDLDVDGGFPAAEELSEHIVSLPLSPDHTDAEIDEVAAAALAATL
jgi:dTDP-3-amino-3,4,6-trideoxy-alpha-D-glucose transaminase